MDNPALGPFGSTRAVRQNNALNREVNNFGAFPDGQNASASHPATNNHQPKGKKSKVIKRSLATSTDPNPRSRDPISPPSAESGGVPSPSPTYLTLAHHPATRLPSPQPILVVIDLNGTLLHRPNKRAASKFVERPLARAFLAACLAKHHVVIWSSARPENVARMCAQLLPPPLLSRVVAVWGRDRFGLSAADYGRRTQCYKRLTKLWADPAVGAAHPLAHDRTQTQTQAGTEGAEAEADGKAEGRTEQGLWTQANTVLIDDSVEKARSEPYNAVTLPEFAGDVDEEPQVLRLVEEYLDELAWQADVSAYIRVNPFSMGGLQPATVAEGD
ncbi:hypothetical protein NEMBOFW57_005840 [Staphylotrichum longicolle]|uniref:Mitochondrial import inner membrane translocase subunit TIM50 n=1 Tax=Staphylotrichum longicolle TaxID=669026 RepID=A0AAD4EXR8_9PEZI|nr:hypothetical protein NEMBOFW57_005840 [Staphylotrichum longicolle]